MADKDSPFWSESYKLRGLVESLINRYLHTLGQFYLQEGTKEPVLEEVLASHGGTQLNAQFVVDQFE